MNALLFLLTGVMNPMTIPQAHVLPVFGCGTSCQVDTEQVSLPEIRKDGWIAIEVIRKRRKVSLGRDRSIQAERNRRQWLFANCQDKKFGISPTWNRSHATIQDVFHKDAERVGHPKFEAIYGSPFLQWAKLCPQEAIHGLRFIQRNYSPNFKPIYRKIGC